MNIQLLSISVLLTKNTSWFKLFIFYHFFLLIVYPSGRAKVHMLRYDVGKSIYFKEEDDG